RLLSCYEDLLDRLALETWEECIRSQANDKDLHSKWVSLQFARVRAELYRRAPLLLGTHLTLLVLNHHVWRNGPEKRNDPIPTQWQRFVGCGVTATAGPGAPSLKPNRNKLTDAHFSKKSYASQHFDDTLFENCVFNESDLSGASFIGSRFVG